MLGEHKKIIKIIIKLQLQNNKPRKSKKRIQISKLQKSKKYKVSKNNYNRQAN